MEKQEIYAALEDYSVKMERVKALFQMANDLAWDRITNGEDESDAMQKIGFLMETAIESLAIREKELDSILKIARENSMDTKSPLA